MSSSLRGLCSIGNLGLDVKGSLSFIGKTSSKECYIPRLNDGVSINLIHFKFNNKKHVGYTVLCIFNEDTINDFWP